MQEKSTYPATSRKSSERLVPLDVLLATKEKLKETENQLEKMKNENEVYKKYLSMLYTFLKIF